MSSGRWTDDDLRRRGLVASGAVQKPAARPERKPTGRSGHVAGEMNRTEARYGVELDLRKHAGLVKWWRFEGLPLWLAPRTVYKADFLVVTPAAIELHEVKGHWEDDARVKLKVAVEMYPCFVFRVFRYDYDRAAFLEVETFNAHERATGTVDR